MNYLQFVNNKMPKTLKESYNRRKIINLNKTIIYENVNEADVWSTIQDVKNTNFGNIFELKAFKENALQNVLNILKDDKPVNDQIKDALSDNNKRRIITNFIAFATATHNLFNHINELLSKRSKDDDEEKFETLLDNNNANEFTKIAFKADSDIQRFTNGAWIKEIIKGDDGIKKIAKNIANANIKSLKIISSNVSKQLKNVHFVSKSICGTTFEPKKTTSGTLPSQTKSTKKTLGTKPSFKKLNKT